jgi:hypothetical protein
MTQKVRMPDGVVVNFPDDMPREEIRALIEEKFPDAAKKAAQPEVAPVPPGGEWKRLGEGEPGIPIISDITRSLYPVERNSETGEMRPAVPSIVTSAIEAAKAPGKAVTGEYGLEVDPETGAVAPFTGPMMDDASALAGMATMGVPKGASLAGAVTNNALTGPARSNILRAMRYDGIDPVEVPARLRALGPDAIPGDLGPALQAQTQALSAIPGMGQKKVVDTLTARKAGRNSRIISEVDETLGPAPIPSRLAAENLANRKALGPEYEAAFANANAVDSSQIALNLDSEVVNLRGEAQTAIKKVRDMLNVVGTDQLDPNPRTLFEVRKAIDGQLNGETDGNVIRVLKAAREQVDMELATKVPRIKQIDAKYAELARQNDAVDTGQTLFESGRSAMRPEELADTMTAGAAPKGEMVGPSAVPFRLTQGARAEIDRLIGTTTNDLNALKTALKGDGSWNRERLVTLYGQEKADKLLGILEREATYSATEGPALGGSRTAVLQQATEEIAGRNKKPGVFQNALNFNGGSALAALGDKTLGWVDRNRRAATGAAMADYLTAQQGAAMLEALPRKGPGAITRNAPVITLRELMMNSERSSGGGAPVRIEM